MESVKGRKRSVELIEGLGFESVRARLLREGDRDDCANRTLAFYLADMKDRKLHREGGHSSVEHFADAQLDMSPRRTRELVRAGTELRGLEHVDAAFLGAALSWTKVLKLLSVVQTTTQVAWVEFALTLSCRELQEEVRRCRPGELPGCGTKSGLDKHKHSVHAELSDLSYAGLERVRAHCCEEWGSEEISDTQVIEALLADWELRHPSEEPEQADPMLPYEEHNHEEIPAETQQLVSARDCHRCRNCHSYYKPQFHHLSRRALGGGNAPSNTFLLCGHCHALVHSKRLKISGDPEAPRMAANALAFAAADGTPVLRRNHSFGDRSPKPEPPAASY